MQTRQLLFSDFVRVNLAIKWRALIAANDGDKTLRIKFCSAQYISNFVSITPDNTHLGEKDHCTADLQSNWTGFDQKKKICSFMYVLKLLNPNHSKSFQLYSDTSAYGDSCPYH